MMGERVVRDALVEHPDILVEASESLRDKQYAPVLAANRQAIEAPFHSSWRGAAKPDVVLAYYFDYACGFCRQSNPDIDRLLKENKDLRVVYRELPILGPNSVAAARASLAASEAGKFNLFHDTLNAAGQPSDESIAKAANAANVAPADAQKPEIEAELRRNFDVAGKLGATGTPLFIVGDRVINSAAGYDVLKKAIDAARDAKS
jgi:protein-disulfide isomerase